MLTCVLIVAAIAQPSAQGPAAAHPSITEVLYAVPTGAKGDADKDGTRHATGDEFVELANLTPAPINLKGYRLSDGKSVNNAPPNAKPKREEEDGGRFIFTFPDLVLQPGQVVVVVNGHKASTPGPVGTEQSAAAANEHFAGAFVFSRRAESPYIGFGNSADCVLLTAPDGTAVECVRWGDGSKVPDAQAERTLIAPEGKGSVQIDKAGGAFVPHTDLPGSDDQTLFSPGRYPGVR